MDRAGHPRHLGASWHRARPQGVIGIATRHEHGEEVLDHIVEVGPAEVNLDRIRKLIRQRITPAPRGVRVG
ncbi:hypothetical protein [Streptomyces sp. NPDC048445]